MKRTAEKNYNKHNNKGITLIALIITSIVLLILAGVTINSLTGSDSAPAKANEATQKNDIGAAKDDVVLTTVSAQQTGYEAVYTEAGVVAQNVSNEVGKIVIQALENKYNSNNTIGKATIDIDVERNGENEITGATVTIYTTDFEVIGNVDISGGVINWDEIESRTETDTETVKPEVGDFVRYDAGKWTAEDGKLYVSLKDKDGVVSKEEANNLSELPSTKYQFGGFTANSSKNENAVSSVENYNYVQEIINENGDKQAVTGWRIFDISNSGITLISAGCPEDYKNPYGTGYAYISEYILTGNINDKADEDKITSKQKTRDWTSDYVSVANQQKGVKATCLSKKVLDLWYKKYVDENTVNLYHSENNYDKVSGGTIFKKIYSTTDNGINNGKYESLIDNYSYYWLGDSFKSSCLYYVTPNVRGVYYNTNTETYGIRVIITLPKEIKLKQKPTETKTITSRNNNYKYNVWEIK